MFDRADGKKVFPKVSMVQEDFEAYIYDASFDTDFFGDYYNEF